MEDLKTINNRTILYYAWQAVLERLAMEHETLRKDHYNAEAKAHIAVYEQQEQELHNRLKELVKEEEDMDKSLNMLKEDKAVTDDKLKDSMKDMLRKLELLEMIIGTRCEEEGANDTAEWLKSFGISERELKKWGWNAEE